MTLLTISVLTQVSPFMYIAKCYRTLLDPADQAILQSDLDAIVDWSELREMPYNASKCKHLSFTKKQKPLETTYFLAGNILSKSACEKDPGVLVNSKLSWHDHIVTKVNKANILPRLEEPVEPTLTLMLSKSFIFILSDLILTMLHRSGLPIRLS